MGSLRFSLTESSAQPKLWLWVQAFTNIHMFYRADKQKSPTYHLLQLIYEKKLGISVLLVHTF